MKVYFYHTQDTERIVREWKQGQFPSHFLYGALQLPDCGIDVVWHHQRHTYKRLRDMLCATWKVLTCRKRYDVLYATHTLGIEPIILLRALGLYRHPIVVWHHQPIVRAKNPLREALARLFYRGMDHMIFFSEKLMQDSLLSKKANPKRMSMVHWGADLDYYDSLLTPPKGEGLRRAFISTGKELRDYETLLQAFHETGLPLTLYAEKKRQAYFEGLHPAENVEMHYGDRPIPHEIAQMVAESRCVCICCQESNYTVGLTTVVEALALGLPILCTRNPQMPMDIEAEGCGFWIEPKDVEGWKEKLRFIADHPKEAEAMGKRGRALAEQYYNVKQCGKETAEIMKQTWKQFKVQVIPTLVFMAIFAVFLAFGTLSSTAKPKEKRHVVRIETNMGNIRVALSDDTPLHSKNFLKLARKGFYDGTLFHRCIKDFMIQGGDPDSRNAEPGQRLGEGGTGYTIPAEFCLPYWYHWRGALAAAREPDDVNPEKESSGCQFYIVYGKKQAAADMRKVRSMLEEKGIELTPQMVDDYYMRGGTPHLDGQYTVFGEVIEGMNIVKDIQKVETDENDRPLKDVVILRMVVEQ